MLWALALAGRTIITLPAHSFSASLSKIRSHHTQAHTSLLQTTNTSENPKCHLIPSIVKRCSKLQTGHSRLLLRHFPVKHPQKARVGSPVEKRLTRRKPICHTSFANLDMRTISHDEPPRIDIHHNLLNAATEDQHSRSLNHGKRLSIDADVGERSTKAYRSQDGALDAIALRAALALLGEKRRTCSVFEDFTDTLARLRRALEVFVSADLLADFLALKSKSDCQRLIPPAN